MTKYTSTHTGEELDEAITAILSRQLDADDLLILVADLSSGASVTTGGTAGWLPKYLVSGS